MRVQLPLSDAVSIEPAESEASNIVIEDRSVTITDIDTTLSIECYGGLLYNVYDLLATQQVLSGEDISRLESQVGSGLTARLEYEDVDCQWTVVTNPSFRPREPAGEKNSPLTKGDVVPLGSDGFARFLGWRGDTTPTFALRSPGMPASRMSRLRLTDADSLFGTQSEQTVSQILL
jgi:hypothetical protein